VDGLGGFTSVPGLIGLGFGDASAASGESVPLGSFTLGVAPTGTTTPMATFDVTTATGFREFAVMSGSLLGNGEPARLIINTSEFPWTSAEVVPSQN
jgi:hypothetical protein